MPFVVANTVYEHCRDTGVAMYEVSVEELLEIKSHTDPESLFVDVDALSFDVDDLIMLDPRQPFVGRIDAVVTFYQE